MRRRCDQDLGWRRRYLASFGLTPAVGETIRSLAHNYSSHTPVSEPLDSCCNETVTSDSEANQGVSSFSHSPDDSR